MALSRSQRTSIMPYSSLWLRSRPVTARRSLHPASSSPLRSPVCHEYQRGYLKSQRGTQSSSMPTSIPKPAASALCPVVYWSNASRPPIHFSAMGPATLQYSSEPYSTPGTRIIPVFTWSTEKSPWSTQHLSSWGW